MKITLCHETDRARWEQLTAAAPDAESGHVWGWLSALRTAYRHKSFYLTAISDDGTPLAALPCVFISSRLYGSELASVPYISYGGVCHSPDSCEEAKAAADAALYRRAIELGTRLGARRVHIRARRPCAEPFEISTEKVTQHLPLAGSPEEQLRRLPSERRNRLRHCQRHGLTSSFAAADLPAALNEFWAVYTENMRALGSPAHSRAFFRAVTSELGSMLSTILIRRNGTTLAAAIALEFNGMLAIPWSGATAEGNRLYASIQLYWDAICLAIQRRCHTFDFGRSSLGSGVYEFKRRWGPIPHQDWWCTYYLKSRARHVRDRGGFQRASTVWRFMPLALTRTLGPHLRKGISN